jgi:hypothetical protein
LARFNPRVLPVGVPLPVEAVTVKLVADPADGDTPVTDVPDSDVAVAKFDVDTPDTGSLKVTVHATDAAFVGEVPARLIAVSVGLTRSTVQV